MSLKDTISAMAQEFLPEVTSFRRHLHQHPELSFQERETSAYIRQFLDDLGISYQYPFAEHGFLARIRGERPGKTIALRSELDALPIQE